MAPKNRTIRTDIPTEVWDRLADEAAAQGIPLGRFLKNLIVTRDAKRQARLAQQQGATPSTDQP